MTLVQPNPPGQDAGDFGADLDARDWHLVRAIAVERSVTRAALARLASRAPSSKEAGPFDIDAWIDAQTAAGLMCVVPASPTIVLGMGGEPRFCLQPSIEQQIVRRLAQTGELVPLTEWVTPIVGERSLGALGLAIARGDLKEFDRQFARLRKLVAISSGEWLRTSVCTAFDPGWLQSVFGDRAADLVCRVLSDSLHQLASCAPLYEWARDAALPTSERLLSQHAILRGEPDAALRFADALPKSDAVLVRAAASFVLGDLPSANEQLTQALSGGRREVDVGYVAPLVAVLLIERDLPAARTYARRLFAKSKGPAEKGIGKAFRTLQHFLERSEPSAKRLDVYQMPADVSAWEFVLTALTVHLHADGSTTRASWAAHLTRRACDWSGNGYEWFGKQALVLAHSLSSSHCNAELKRLGHGSALLSLAPRELILWDRVTPKPEWKKTLEALAEVSKTIERSAESAYRVAWIIDVPTMSFSRPLLQRYNADAGGWTSGRRISLEELRAVASQLPIEDRDVLRHWTSGDAELDVSDLDSESPPFDGPRADVGPEMFQALIGHPRVHNGSSLRETIDVVRGVCRVMTHDEAGGIRVAVEPHGAQLGINVVAQGSARIAVYHLDEALHRVMRVLPHGVRIPKDQESALIEVLSKLAVGVEVESPHLGAERTIVADPTPCIRIAAHSGGFLVQVGVRPFGEGGRFFAAAGGRRSAHAMVEGRRLRCERNFEQEQRLGEALIAACPTLVPDNDEERDQGAFLTEEEVLALLSELGETEVSHSLEWRGTPGLHLSGRVTRKGLHGRLRCIKGWYVAEGSVDLDAQTAARLSDICEAPILSRGRFIRVAPGQYAEVEASMQRTMAMLRLASTGRGKELRFHATAVPLLKELAASPDIFDVDAPTSDWLKRVQTVKKARFEVPSSIRAELRPYQKEGVRWLRTLCELGIGACLADDMGLGKTLQIIAVLAALSDAGPALVVAPTSVCTNWMLELARFAPDLKVTDYAESDRGAALRDAPSGVWICSYAIAQQDAAVLGEIDWNVVVLDEAQFIKNPGSLRARAAYKLKARCRIAATGTPVENNLGDLWAIFRFLNPGLLGDWPQFRRRFVLPVERDGSDEASISLRALIGGYVLRRMKGEVLSELPPLTPVIVDVALGEEETALYALLQQQIRQKLFSPQGRGNKIEALAQITRLRRFCCHPKLVFPDAEVESSKIEMLIELVEELRINGHRALVFSQYVDFLALVREHLDERGITYEYLDGATPRRVRQARVDAFQDGSATLFLISLKAGGFGLNLTGADYVLHLDPWWNPAVEAQATDRAHRIGQNRPVTVYRLVTQHTIEEKIVAMQQKKQELASSVLNDSQAAAKLSTDDLLALVEAR